MTSHRTRTTAVVAQRSLDLQRMHASRGALDEGAGPVQSLAQKIQESFLTSAGTINGVENFGVATAREFLAAVDDCVRGFNIVAGLSGELASSIRCAVLQSSFPALVWCRCGKGAAGFDWIARMWELHAAAFGAHHPGAGVRNPASYQLEKAVLSDAGVEEEIAIYNAAISELLAQRGRDTRIRQSLRRLRTHLGVDFGEVGQMLGVSQDIVRHWESAEVQVPDPERAAILGADSALAELLEIYRPERLPDVIRRPARLFEGQRALDWILAGRIQEVAERYRRTFLYQA